MAGQFVVISKEGEVGKEGSTTALITQRGPVTRLIAANGQLLTAMEIRQKCVHDVGNKG